jgi:hypothetical protein
MRALSRQRSAIRRISQAEASFGFPSRLPSAAPSHVPRPVAAGAGERTAAPAPPPLTSPPLAPRTAMTTPPQIVWCLADATGQVWRHPEKAYLEQWVARRNAQGTPVGALPYRPFRAPAPGYGFPVPGR